MKDIFYGKHEVCLFKTRIRNAALIIFTLLICSGISHAAKTYPVKLHNLMVEYIKNPLGIDIENPRFTWQMINPENQRGYSQTAYQIVVTNEAGEQVWDSKKIKSDLSLNIEYAGTKLQPCTRYSWTVNVWDQNDKQTSAISWFETGLMSKSDISKGWNSAKWIGGGDEDMVLYAHYFPIFNINFSLQLDEKTKTTRAGFVYGANDDRLMDKNKNLFHLESSKDDSYLLIELNIEPLATNENARLNIYRAGYHGNDNPNMPFKSFSIPLTIINNQNKYAKHSIRLSTNLGHSRIYINGDRNEHKIADLNLNPLGQGGDFIAFPVIGDIGFSVPKGQVAWFSDLEIRNFRSPSNIIFTEELANKDYQGIFTEITDNLSIEKQAYKVNGGDTGTFLTATPGGNSTPMLRTTFNTSQTEIAKARLYVTAHGIYEIYMNGERISEDYFNPGLTQYNKTLLYQTYDVTKYIRPKENALGAILAEGWWSGGSTFVGENWNFFGDRQSLLAKLVITYSDGKEDIITTDPSTWHYFNRGPIVYGSFFQGEVYDASKEALIEGWSLPSYNASAWKPAQEIKLEGSISPIATAEEYSKRTLTGQMEQTVKQINELTALSVEEVRPGVFVYDMGQNMVGVPKISLSGIKPGTKITLRFAEVKYPDLPEYKGNTGMIMLENIRAAMAQDIYIAKGGSETILPRFTFHGYRFLEITGIENPLPIENVKGVVLSSIHELASFYETSNSKVNKLWENITWSTFGNFLSIPTDCPQRNERLGWSGDISVFARTATYLSNVSQFLSKHMLAMRDVQREDGKFPDVAPLGFGFGGLLWGSAGITVAWECYQQYGDKRLLHEHYDAMKRYIHYIQDKTIDPNTNIIVQDRAWGDLGDWLGPEDDKNDRSLLWEAYFIYDLDMMKQIATILQKQEDAEWFATLCNERKEFFNKTYVQIEDGKTVFSDFDGFKKGRVIDTQTSYVLPIIFNIIDETNKTKVIENLTKTIIRENKADNGTICPPYSLMTGFIGTTWISKALSDNGRSDIAYRLLQQTDYPSWLYSVEQGSTTIWERLNSYTHTGGFGGNNRMNSFNHYSFGAIGAWMYAHSLGIHRDESSPGFKHFILKPEVDPTGEMTYAKGYYDSMYGRIESSWNIENKIVQYTFTIPANTSATLYLPVSSSKNIKENGKSIKKSVGVKYVGTEKDYVTLELQAGNYLFSAPL